MLSAIYVTAAYLISLPLVIQVHRARADLQTNPEIDTYQFSRGIQQRPDLSSIRETIQNLDGELAQHQKRTCQLGINNHHCALVDLDRIMASSEWLKSGHSPGKRSSTMLDQETAERYGKILEEIIRKRQNLAILNTLLSQANENIQKRKRSCLFELGGQCRTELASAIADQYYYLHGPSSPGKRRRRSVNTPVRLFGKTRPLL